MDHVFSPRVAETEAKTNGDPLVLVGRPVLGVRVYDGGSFDAVGDLDLWRTAVCQRNTDELKEVTEKLLVADELTLTLVDLQLDSRLKFDGFQKVCDFLIEMEMLQLIRRVKTPPRV